MDEQVLESNEGINVERMFTDDGEEVLDTIKYKRSSSKITEPDGTIVYEMDNVEVPEDWSQLATDIIVSKYFRKAGLPSSPGHETSARQVVHRISHTIRDFGERKGYFASLDDADAFEEELSFMLITQRGAFNSPVWFNCGLYHEYGIEGTGGSFYWDPISKRIESTDNAYEHPQCSACFIQSVSDDLMDIYQLVKNEARLFKYGSGTGSNFSPLRSKYEHLSGGGTSSGLLSFLEVFDSQKAHRKLTGTIS